MPKYFGRAADVEPSRRLKCDNCDTIFVMADVEPTIGRIHERVDPGGVMPAGECRLCGALVYPYTKQDEYIEKKGNICPYCDSRDIGTLELNYDFLDDGELRQEVMCFACNQRWTDVYVLDRYVAR